MSTWAVLETGGKQYKASEGDILEVEKISGDKDGNITFDHVLLIGTDKDLVIGAPYVEKAKVKGKITAQFKAPKIRVVKFKSKSRYLIQNGHRQEKTKVKIEKILV